MLHSGNWEEPYKSPEERRKDKQTLDGKKKHFKTCEKNRSKRKKKKK